MLSSAILLTKTCVLCDSGEAFFNHLFKLEEEPDQKTLQKGFNRGIAFFLPDDYPGADILIPVRTPTSAREMSFLAIQGKNRKGDSRSTELRAETRTSFQKASEALGFNVPFIGLTNGPPWLAKTRPRRS